MFRQCCSRSVASGSSLRATSPFHSSATLQVISGRARKTRAVEQTNIQNRAERKQLETENRPHVVVGHRPGDTAKWTSCDLAKVIIREEDISRTHVEALQTGKINMPDYFNFGIGDVEKEMLFDLLPQLTIEHLTDGTRDPNTLKSHYMDGSEKELFGMKMMARLASLRNANADGIAYVNRQRIIAEFSEPANPEDSGRPEVQAALLTYKIRNLWEHLQKFKADVGNRRGLTRMVHQRAKILKYLKGVDRDRYDSALSRMGLEPEAVEGELVV